MPSVPFTFHSEFEVNTIRSCIGIKWRISFTSLSSRLKVTASVATSGLEVLKLFIAPDCDAHSVFGFSVEFAYIFLC